MYITETTHRQHVTRIVLLGSHKSRKLASSVSQISTSVTPHETMCMDFGTDVDVGEYITITFDDEHIPVDHTSNPAKPRSKNKRVEDFVIIYLDAGTTESRRYRLENCHAAIVVQSHDEKLSFDLIEDLISAGIPFMVWCIDGGQTIAESLVPSALQETQWFQGCVGLSCSARRDVFSSMRYCTKYPISPLWSKEKDMFTPEAWKALQKTFWLLDVDKDGFLNDAEVLLWHNKLFGVTEDKDIEYLKFFLRPKQGKTKSKVNQPDELHDSETMIGTRGVALHGFLSVTQAMIKGKLCPYIWIMLHSSGFNDKCLPYEESDLQTLQTNLEVTTSSFYELSECGERFFKSLIVDKKFKSFAVLWDFTPEPLWSDYDILRDSQTHDSKFDSSKSEVQFLPLFSKWHPSSHNTVAKGLTYHPEYMKPDLRATADQFLLLWRNECIANWRIAAIYARWWHFTESLSSLFELRTRLSSANTASTSTVLRSLVMGPSGCGKTSLIRHIAYDISPTGLEAKKGKAIIGAPKDAKRPQKSKRSSYARRKSKDTLSCIRNWVIPNPGGATNEVIFPCFIPQNPSSNILAKRTEKIQRKSLVHAEATEYCIAMVDVAEKDCRACLLDTSFMSTIDVILLLFEGNEDGLVFVNTLLANCVNLGLNTPVLMVRTKSDLYVNQPLNCFFDAELCHKLEHPPIITSVVSSDISTDVSSENNDIPPNSSWNQVGSLMQLILEARREGVASVYCSPTTESSRISPSYSFLHCGKHTGYFISTCLAFLVLAIMKKKLRRANFN